MFPFRIKKNKFLGDLKIYTTTSFFATKGADYVSLQQQKKIQEPVSWRGKPALQPNMRNLQLIPVVIPCSDLLLYFLGIRAGCRREPADVERGDPQHEAQAASPQEARQR
jgi:hypothetical protein